MEITTEGSDYRLVWGLCWCYVWPIAIDEQIGPCGRCYEEPQLLHPAITRRSEAVEIFKERYGREPEPMEGKKVA